MLIQQDKVTFTLLYWIKFSVWCLDQEEVFLLPCSWICFLSPLLHGDNVGYVLQWSFFYNFLRHRNTEVITSYWKQSFEEVTDNWKLSNSFDNILVCCFKSQRPGFWDSLFFPPFWNSLSNAARLTQLSTLQVASRATFQYSYFCSAIAEFNQSCLCRNLECQKLFLIWQGDTVNC